MPSPEAIALRVSIQDLSDPPVDRPLQLLWTLPVDTAGWRWWDDIADARDITSGPALSNMFSLADHRVSLYPFSSVTSDSHGLSLAVPMDEPIAQRFEAAADFGQIF